MKRELARFGPQAGIGDAVEAWPAAVGLEIARNAWPARFQRDGTLIVHTRDAVWGFELTQRIAEISGRMPGKPPLRFVPGPLPERGGERARTHEPELPSPTPEQVQQAAAWSAAIEDSDLREAVARAAAASLAGGAG